MINVGLLKSPILEFSVDTLYPVKKFNSNGTNWEEAIEGNQNTAPNTWLKR